MDAHGQETFRDFVANRSPALLRTAILLSGGDRHAAEAEQPVQELVAWAGNDHLLAWRCGPGSCKGTSEFRSRLVLVDVPGKKTRELTGFRDSNAPDSWEPVFTRR